MHRSTVNGHIIARHRFPAFDRRRIVSVILLTFICISTNPRNGFFTRSWYRKTSAPIQRKNVLSPRNLWENVIHRFSNHDGIKYTNYGLFSIRRRYSGVDIVLLSKNISICRLDGDQSSFCSWFADTFAHGMSMFHTSNLALTAVRLFASLKFINWILSLCLVHPSQTINVLQSIFYSHTTYPLFSVLNADRLWIDLIFMNTIIYKSLLTLEKVARYRSFHDSANFTVYSFILLVIIGGMSNSLAEYIIDHTVDGMNGSLAACIGYSLQASPYTPLIRVYDSELHPGEILCYIFLVYLTLALFDSRRTTPSTMLTWIFGAFGGVALYEIQIRPFLFFYGPIHTLQIECQKYPKGEYTSKSGIWRTKR